MFTELSGKASASSQEKLCAGPGTECLAVTRAWLPGDIMVSARLLLSGSASLFVEVVLAVTKGKGDFAPASREVGGHRTSNLDSISP